jgi:hypothetical protein
VERSGHALDHPGVGTQIREFVTQSMAAAMEGKARRNLPIPFKSQDKSAKRLSQSSFG